MKITQEQEGLSEAERSRIKMLILFPGTKNSYEEFIGHKTEVIDTCRPDKGVYDIEITEGRKSFDSDETYVPNLELARRLADEGVEALVGQRVTRGSIGHPDFYGLPVRRKPGDSKNGQ